MAENSAGTTGQAAWVDLTVENAGQVRDFYAKVMGWSVQEVAMGEYADYAMVPQGASQAVAGVCHHRGPNTGIPPVWMVYFTVADLDAAIAAVQSEGGSVVKPPAGAAAPRFAVIRDPAGAHCVLYQAV
jgi:predicted enzyme related to lactoylglutathione lyase